MLKKAWKEKLKIPTIGNAQLEYAGEGNLDEFGQMNIEDSSILVYPRTFWVFNGNKSIVNSVRNSIYFQDESNHAINQFSVVNKRLRTTFRL